MKCDGPKQDETGMEYCPWDPSNIGFDCVACEELREHWDELMADMKREEAKETWG